MMTTPQAQLDWIATQQDEMIETLIEWSNINSGSYHLVGLNKMQTVLLTHFEALLDDADLIETIALPDLELLDKSGKVKLQPTANVIKISKRPQCRKRVLLCGHYDTVFAESSMFQVAKLIDNNLLNGPGVADMKGGIVVMAKALQAFEQTAEAANVGWTVLLVPDEEIGSISSSVTCFQAVADAADFGMLYEPSLPSGAFVGGRKGSGNFSVVVRGKSAHAGREFDKGRNAIVKAAELMTEINRLNDKYAPSTINIGVIEGGQALNVVPKLAIFKFNIRVLENSLADAILADVKAIFAAHQDADYKIELHGKVTRPIKPMDSAQQKLFAQLKTCCTKLGLDYQLIDSGGCCDGNNLKHMGLPNIDTLGVRGANIHTDQEMVYLDSLVERTQLSFLLLQAFASGQFSLN